MSLGDVTVIVEGRSFAVELLASATAANGVPAAAAGIEIGKLSVLGRVPRKIRVGVKSTGFALVDIDLDA